MKIRNGFVSNSSSSSFIVAFPSKPRGAGETRIMVFKNASPNSIISRFDDSDKSTVKQISEFIYKDIKSKESASLKEVEAFFQGASEYDFPNYFPKIEYGDPKDTKEEGDKRWKEYEEKTEIAAKKMAKEFYDKYKDNFIYIVEYSDNDSDFMAMMEHSEIYENLPYKVISNH